MLSVLKERKYLGEKYRDNFINSNAKYKDLKNLLNSIVEKEKKFKTDCIDWNNEQIKKFLRDLKSISPNVLSRVIIYLRTFIEYICKIEELPVPEVKLDFGTLHELVDYDSLLETIISPQQYKFIRSQLDLNVRDKLIFELAWEPGLTNEEIRNLKEKDIEFKTTQDGNEIAILRLSEKKILKVEDPEVVEDIKKCMKESYFYAENKTGTPKTYEYKHSQYLIKPVNVGRPKKEDYIVNPSLSLQKAIQTQGVTCKGINVFALTLESIKRSKIIYMLSPKNRKYFDKDFIKNLYNLETDGNLYWYEKLAKLKYGEE